MRHRRSFRKLSRTAAHRKALLRNLVTALFIHDRIETTVAKAKEARRLAERLITYAKRNTLHSRRLVAAVLFEPAAVQRLFDEIAPLYATRPGGYTRVLKSRIRLGDAGQMGYLELVKTREQKDAARKRKEEAEAVVSGAADKGKKKGGLFGRGKKSETATAEVATETATAEKKAREPKAPRKERQRQGGEGDHPGRPGGRGGKGGPPTSPRKTRGSQRGQ